MAIKKEVEAQKFRETFLGFQIDSIEKELDKLLNSGVAPQEILKECQKCMEEIGAKFEAGEYFLPELIMAGEIFKKVNARIKPLITSGKKEAIGKIVLGTPKGDRHNLGKDIFAILAEASGFEIYDLGVDVQPEIFIRKLEETGAQILGISVLLTSAFPSLQEIVRLLEEKEMRDRVSVLVGGGVTTQDMVGRFKIDAQTRDAFEGVRIAQSFIIQMEEA